VERVFDGLVEYSCGGSGVVTTLGSGWRGYLVGVGWWVVVGVVVEGERRGELEAGVSGEVQPT
jgi:hypothetical protein